MFSYPYSYTHTYTYTPFFSVILPIIAAIVIIAGGLALYFLFVRKPNRFQGTAAKLHDALNFRTFYTEKLIRALYCITVVGIVIYSVALLFSHFFTALLLFVLGNLAARIVYEYALLLLVLCRNTQEINRKMRSPKSSRFRLPPAPARHLPLRSSPLCRRSTRSRPSLRRQTLRYRRRKLLSSRLCLRRTVSSHNISSYSPSEFFTAACRMSVNFCAPLCYNITEHPPASQPVKEGDFHAVKASIGCPKHPSAERLGAAAHRTGTPSVPHRTGFGCDGGQHQELCRCRRTISRRI